jgi:hypothetical protein
MRHNMELVDLVSGFKPGVEGGFIVEDRTGVSG